MSDTYFIGYDAREHEAAAVCAYSILSRATRRSKVYMLEHRALRRMGLFKRSWEIDAKGQFTDKVDGKPFSTEFSHSRFLVFELARALKITGPCAFLDCDFNFLQDPSPMMRAHVSTGLPISVVKRDRKVKAGMKMDGMKQVNYPRKLWSALFTFTPSEELANQFTPEAVNTLPGRDMHTFLAFKEEQIGEIDPAYHYIPSLDDAEDFPEGVKAVHFSEFSPWINPERAASHAWEYDAWHTERASLLRNAARTGALLLCDNLEDDYRKAARVG